MAEREPVAELGAFSSPGAVSPGWARARGDLQDAQVYWLSSAAGSLAGRRVVLLHRSHRAQSQEPRAEPELRPYDRRNTLENGLDLVVEGEAAKVCDEAEFRSVAEAFESKYGSHFTAPEGTWSGLW